MKTIKVEGIGAFVIDFTRSVEDGNKVYIAPLNSDNFKAYKVDGSIYLMENIERTLKSKAEEIKQDFSISSTNDFVDSLDKLISDCDKLFSDSKERGFITSRLKQIKNKISN